MEAGLFNHFEQFITEEGAGGRPRSIKVSSIEIKPDVTVSSASSPAFSYRFLACFQLFSRPQSSFSDADEYVFLK